MLSNRRKRKLGTRFAMEHNLDFYSVFELVKGYNAKCDEDYINVLKEVYL